MTPADVVQQCFCYLLDHVCLETGLLDKLFEQDLISAIDKEHVEKISDRMLAREQLMLLLVRQLGHSPGDWTKFLDCLECEIVKLRHVGTKLRVTAERNATVAACDANLSEEETTRDDILQLWSRIIDGVNSFDVRHRLFQSKVIALNDYNEIISARGRREQMEKLLEILYRTPADRRPFFQLRTHLKKKHSDLVEGLDIIKAMRNKFTELLSTLTVTINQLVPALLNREVLTQQDKESVNSWRVTFGDYIAVERFLLMMCVRANTWAKFDAFVECLREDEQKHVADILTEGKRLAQAPEQLCDTIDVVRALEDEELVKSRIQQCFGQLVDTVSSDDVLGFLFEKSVISVGDYERIIASSVVECPMEILVRTLFHLEPRKRPFSWLRKALIAAKIHQEFVDYMDNIKPVHGYYADPVLVSESIVPTGVWGIGVLDDFIYVALHNQGHLQKYTTGNPPEHIGTIPVPGLIWPTDLVADPGNHCLYVTDRYSTDKASSSIFTVTPNDGSVTKFTVDGAQAGGISLSRDGRRVLVICEHFKEGRSLRFFHGVDVGEARRGLEKIPDYPQLKLDKCERYLLQAVEITEKKLYAITQTHKSRQIHQILLIDNDGCEIFAFGKPRQTPLSLNFPWCLYITPSGLIIANDAEKSRILLLELVDDRLEFRRELISAHAAQEFKCRCFFPRRFCVDERRGIVYVGNGIKGTKVDGKAPVDGSVMVWKISDPETAVQVFDV